MSTADITSSVSPTRMGAHNSNRPFAIERLTWLRRAKRLGVAISIATAGAATTAAAVEPDCRAAFEQLDANRNGVVDPTEFGMNKIAVVYRAAPRPLIRGGEPVDIIPFERTRISRRAFDELDLKRDGVLDAYDITRAPMFQFSWWSRDRDNVIDWTEFQAGCQELERP